METVYLMLDYFDKDKIPSGLKVLILAPHPDDFDAIAVTLKKFRDNGNSLELAVISGSASGVEDSFCKNHPGLNKAQIREKEQLESCDFFGLPPKNVSFLRLAEDADGNPTESDENLKMLEKFLSKASPNIVFMPHWNDTNPGHQRAYSMFKKLAPPCTLYLNRDAKTIEMRHDIYTVFDEETAKWKAELLRSHKSQHQRNLNTRGHGFDERVLRVNQQIAEENDCAYPYAEAFEIETIK